jgi:uncharacterized membrane protein
MLIYVLHHLARTLQADYVLARIGRELSHAMTSTWPDGDEADPATAVAWDDIDAGDAIVAPASGYILSIDVERLVQTGANEDLRLRLDRRPGHFVLEGAVLGRCAPAGRWSEDARAAIVDAIVIGSVRTAAQDLAFSIDAIVEIALRALSPGVNDSFTAIVAINHLGAALGHALQRRMPPRGLADDEDTVRLLVCPLDFEGLAASAYKPLRQSLAGNVMVVMRLIEVLGELAELVAEAAEIEALTDHLASMEDLVRRTVPDERDQADLARRVATTRLRLDRARERLAP